MTTFQINGREWEALYDEPHHLFKVYAALRRHMDYATGVAGLDRRFSEQFFRETLYIEPRPGRCKTESGSPSKKAIYHALNALAKVTSRDGSKTPLLIMRKDLGPFVFELPLATTDRSAQKQRGTNGERKRDPMGNIMSDANKTDKSNNGGLSGEDIQSNGGHKRDHEDFKSVPQMGTPPESGSGNNFNDTPPRACARKQAIPEDWRPSERCYRLIEDAGVPRSFADQCLGEFLLYWSDSQEKRFSWDSTFLNRVKTEWIRMQKEATPTTNAASGRSEVPKGGIHREADQQNYRSAISRQAEAERAYQMRQQAERGGGCELNGNTIEAEYSEIQR